MKKVTRIIQLTCPDCMGSGILSVFRGRVKCGKCKGTGEISQVITEIPQDENTLNSK